MSPSVNNILENQNNLPMEPGRQYKNYSHAIATTSTPAGYDLEFCLDTGSGMSLISRDTLKQFFPTVKIETMPRIDIGGVGSGGNSSYEYTNIPLELTTTRKETVTFSCEAHVVEELSCSLLVGMNTLINNRIDLHLSKDYMTVGHHKVTIRTKAVKKRKRVAVYFAGQAPVTVPSGYSVKIPIKHRRLPTESEEIYILEPEATVDMSLGVFASAPKAVINQNQTIPFSNFGNSPITLRPGKRIGMLEKYSEREIPNNSIPVMLAAV